MKVACIFPGQGSQSVGMLNSLANAYPQVEKTVARASEILGYDLWKIIKDGPVEELNNTEITQPAMLVAGYIVGQLLFEEKAIRAEVVAGHSLGEYTALCYAGSIKFEDAVKIVSKRGQLMQQAVSPGQGAMAAILGLDDQQVITACEKAAQSDVVSAVNFNSPGQVVIAGDKSAVDRAIEECKTAGAKRAIMLPVSVPSHCSLMQPAAEKLLIELETVEIKPAEIPVIHNYNVEVASSPDSIREALIRQLYSPVKWVDTINKIKAMKTTELILECGPGKALTGLCKRIDRKLLIKAVNDAESLENVLG